MSDVFVSYVSEDRAIAEKISRGLEGAGFSVWWDRHIRGGVDFAPEIARQLDAAKVVIVLWSKASLESGWVRDEAQQARDENKLIPVRLDSVQPPLGFRQYQTIDFWRAKGARRTSRIHELLQAVEAVAPEAAGSARKPSHFYVFWRRKILF